MSRVLAVVFLLVVAALPAVASGNLPPVAAATASPSEAVLGQPILFADGSADPDGEIVRRVWTFTDGRSVEGREVRHVPPYAGLHTVRLEVTDDAGAVAWTELQVLVRAPLMHGRAVAARMGEAALADTGEMEAETHATRTADFGGARHGQLRLAGLDVEVRAVENRAIARASAGYLVVPLPVGYVLVTGIETESLATCACTTLTSKFTQVRLNDDPLVPPGAVPPNTVVALPGGSSLALNVQERSEEGRDVVVGVRWTSPLGDVAEIARAESGVSHCPWSE